MLVVVTPLRKNGFRIPARDLAECDISGDLVIGQRWVTSTQSRLAAEIRKHGSQLPGEDQILMVLFDPEIRSWRGSTFKLNGWEVLEWKDEGRQLVLQEWACQIQGL